MHPGVERKERRHAWASCLAEGQSKASGTLQNVLPIMIMSTDGNRFAFALDKMTIGGLAHDANDHRITEPSDL